MSTGDGVMQDRERRQFLVPIDQFFELANPSGPSAPKGE